MEINCIDECLLCLLYGDTRFQLSDTFLNWLDYITRHEMIPAVENLNMKIYYEFRGLSLYIYMKGLLQ